MSRKMIEYFVQQMQYDFKMSLVKELTYFLGFKVKQMKGGIFVSQINYAKNIVVKFGIENARHNRTPASTHVKLTKDDGNENVTNILDDIPRHVKEKSRDVESDKLNDEEFNVGASSEERETITKEVEEDT